MNICQAAVVHHAGVLCCQSDRGDVHQAWCAASQAMFTTQAAWCAASHQVGGDIHQPVTLGSSTVSILWTTLLHAQMSCSTIQAEEFLHTQRAGGVRARQVCACVWILQQERGLVCIPGV